MNFLIFLFSYLGLQNYTSYWGQPDLRNCTGGYISVGLCKDICSLYAKLLKNNSKKNQCKVNELRESAPQFNSAHPLKTLDTSY